MREEFQVVVATNAEDLNVDVNRLLEEGWRLRGNVVLALDVVKSENFFEERFFQLAQALTREVKT